jgi:hypothetical protein
MTADALYEKHWLLAYEANIKGWLPNGAGTDYVVNDANFGFLKQNNVFFYDSALAAPAPPAPAQVPLPTLPTAASLVIFVGYD